MPKKVYFGVDNKARKVKKMYFGVDDKARTVKKAYIGIGGVARPFWPSGLSYYGQVTELSQTRTKAASANAGNYALFAGGYTYDRNGRVMGSSNVVDAYDASLTRIIPTALSTSESSLAGASVGNYALFTVDDVAYAYNASLTLSLPTTLSDARSGNAAASVGNYALFAGGYNSGSYKSRVDAYNASLTRSTASNLTKGRDRLAGASNGEVAVFAGGAYPQMSRHVDAYDSSLTRVNTRESYMTNARADLKGEAVGDYVLFAGGEGGIDAVEAIDSSLTARTLQSLTVGRHDMGSAALGTYALFAGGTYVNNSGSHIILATVDVYDASLTHTAFTSLSVARQWPAGATVGNYALFAGGNREYKQAMAGDYVATVDCYSI